MSMELGDSNNLLSGGGGRVNVFWRSRTDFERKLLVALFVLSAAVIALIVAVAVLASHGSAVKGSNTSKTTSKFSFLDPVDSKFYPGIANMPAAMEARQNAHTPTEVSHAHTPTQDTQRHAHTPTQDTQRHAHTPTQDIQQHAQRLSQASQHPHKRPLKQAIVTPILASKRHAHPG
ncbi:uncharacterized protein [Procambarus clarkii]|uniref:uncharacterized protein n=1 Tax=Procambarus clarkii TaxID=6728 RepID=UPI003743C313